MSETPVVQTGSPAWSPYVPQLWAHAWLCSFGVSAAITLEQAFHFRTKESGKETIPQGGVLWAGSLELCCQYLDLTGHWALTPQL